MSAHEELTAAWSEWQNADLYKKWRRSNPGEAQQLDAYRAGGTRPTLATATGRALVDETAAWLATSPTPPPDPDPNPSPSGQPMPVGDLPGWRQIFTDDFNTNVPSGANTAAAGAAGYFPQAVSSKWKAYPWPWTGTPNWANYFPERTVSIHDSVMDVWLHDELVDGQRKYLIAACEPLVNGPTSPRYLSAGRYAIRFKTDKFTQYHASFLLWPQADDNGSQKWPASGEIDFPEGNFDSNVNAYMHRQGATSGGDQDAYETNVPMFSVWHTAVIEWKSGTYCRFLLDDVLIGSTTSRVPISPMRWVIQNGGRFGWTPQPGINGHVLIDWVAVYAAV